MEYGIALAGGGARGAAHVGVLMALEEAGLCPAAIAGASAGAIVAGLYASGVGPSVLKNLVLDLAIHGSRLIDPDYGGIIKSVLQFIIRRPVSVQGLLKGKKLEQYLCSLTGGKGMRNTRIPVIIPAVDLYTGKTIAFTDCVRCVRPVRDVEWRTDVLLCEAMRASAAVPAVFRPKSIDDMRLVDGGLTDNLPVDLLLAYGVHRVLAIDVSEEYEAPEYNNIIETASHSLTILTTRLRDHMVKGEKLLLKPALPREAGLLTFENMAACMEAGYRAASEQLDTIRYLFG